MAGRIRTLRASLIPALIGVMTGAAALLGGSGARAEALTVNVDFAYYNPVSLVLKSKHPD